MVIFRALDHRLIQSCIIAMQESTSGWQHQTRIRLANPIFQDSCSQLTRGMTDLLVTLCSGLDWSLLTGVRRHCRYNRNVPNFAEPLQYRLISGNMGRDAAPLWKFKLLEQNHVMALFAQYALTHGSGDCCAAYQWSLRGNIFIYVDADSPCSSVTDSLRMSNYFLVCHNR